MRERVRKRKRKRKRKRTRTIKRKRKMNYLATFIKNTVIKYPSCLFKR